MAMPFPIFGYMENPNMHYNYILKSITAPKDETMNDPRPTHLKSFPIFYQWKAINKERLNFR